MDSMWSRLDQALSVTAPLLAAAVLFACGYVVGSAAKDWYDSVPDYSCSGSESGSDEPDSGSDEPDSDDQDSEAGENVSSAGGVTDDSAMDSPAGSDTDEDSLSPERKIEQELATLIQPIECNDSDVEDPFIIEDVGTVDAVDAVDDDHLEYEHMDAEHNPPVTDLDYDRLDDHTEDEIPTTEQDDEPPSAETKG